MSDALRQRLIETACAMNRSGINSGTSGNLSARWQDGMLITPSGMAYEGLEPDDIVFVDGAGAPSGARKPSSEWRFHLDIYRHRADAQAVVHAHPVHCAALACMGRDIPAFHYMVAVAGGDSIRCCGYATFGTQALSDLVLHALQGRKACLMGHHGLVCHDATPERALALAVEVEHLAAMYCQCLQLGEPALLSSKEMASVLEKFRHYGANAQQD